MDFMDKLERKLGRFAVPRLTEVLIFGQVVVFLAKSAGWLRLEDVLLIPERVLAGEYRRLVTFLFIPPNWNPLWIVFALIFFYFMGTALESHWGEFRYNLFIFAGYIATLAVSFLMPVEEATNAFIGGSVFLAFAQLYPDFVIYLFFILPVKVKWIAWLTWITYLLGIISGPSSRRLMILASVANFLLFFGPDLLERMRRGGSSLVMKTREIKSSLQPFHICGVCGATEQSHPDMEFRYCTRCRGDLGYCSDHIRNHPHVH